MSLAPTLDNTLYPVCKIMQIDEKFKEFIVTNELSKLLEHLITANSIDMLEESLPDLTNSPSDKG